ncbi:MAG: fumarate reductase/succinate dehydrogenase flavoprotein subunit, partial [Planctomycetota bacterium]
ANRLGGNSLSDLLVFGRRAGLHAARYARSLPATPSVDEGEVQEGLARAVAPLGRAGENPYAIHHDLQEMMDRNVQLVRDKGELAMAVEALRRFRERVRKAGAGGSRVYNPGWHLALDLENLVEISEMVARAALLREESRGAHTRLDHPESDPKWAKVNVVTRRRDGEMEVTTEPLPELPEEWRAYVHGDKA